MRVIRIRLSRRTIVSSIPEQNDHHFVDDIFKCNFMNEKFTFWFELHGILFLLGPIDDEAAWMTKISYTWYITSARYVVWTYASKHHSIFSTHSTSWYMTNGIINADDACMRFWRRTLLFQIMVCRLFSTKSLSHPVLTYYHLDPSEQASLFKSKYNNVHQMELFHKHRLQTDSHFVAASVS